MEKVLAFLSSWIVRYLANAISAAGMLWAATPEQNAAVTAWAGGAITFLFAALLRYVKLYYLKLTGKQAAKVVAVLVLSAMLYQLQRSAFASYAAALERSPAFVWQPSGIRCPLTAIL